jgi:hypothetical protein
MQQMDTRVTLSLLLESLIAMITYIPYAMELIYSNATKEQQKSPWRLAWENVFVEFIHLLSYLFFASTFYVSLFANVGFRRQVRKAFDKRQKTSLSMRRPQGTI